MIFDKACGKVRITVSEPSPSRVTIEHDGNSLSGMQLDDLRDLRHLIDRALAAAK